MQVFKLVFKLIKENSVSIMITLIVTVLISLLFVKTGAMGATFNEDIKASIHIVDKNNSEQSKDLVSYLKEKCEVIDMEEDLIEESLFYQQLVYVLYIPEDYDTTLMSGERVHLQKKVCANSAGSYLVNQYVEEYLTATQNYVKYMPSASFKEISKLVKNDFSKEVKMEVKQSESKDNIHLYFNFFGYSFVCSIIAGIGYSMHKLSTREIKRRNIISPMKNINLNIQQILAYACFAVLIFVVAITFGYVIFYDSMQAVFVPYMILNLGVYLLPCLGLAYLIGTIIRSLEVQNGMANVLGLIMAFLGGSFVPQSLLSDALIQIASFTPNYWFVKANDALYDMKTFDFENLKPIFSYMGIEVLFAAVFFFIAIIYAKFKRSNVV